MYQHIAEIVLHYYFTNTLNFIYILNYKKLFIKSLNFNNPIISSSYDIYNGPPTVLFRKQNNLNLAQNNLQNKWNEFLYSLILQSEKVETQDII